jgi:hypothetical protein
VTSRGHSFCRAGSTRRFINDVGQSPTYKSPPPSLRA